MAAPTTPPATTAPLAAGTRLLGLPTVARLARFARAGRAVLLTTAERAAAFRDAPVFGAPVAFDPTLADWHDRNDLVVLTLAHALRPFPSDPDRYALELRLGVAIPRDDLLDRLVRYGYDRDALPGFTVRGDTVDLFLGADPDRDVVRLSFFGAELDGMERDGAPLEALTLGPRDLERLVADEEDGDEPEAWTSTVLEACPGEVFLDAPELIEGELGGEAAPGSSRSSPAAAPPRSVATRCRSRRGRDRGPARVLPRDARRLRRRGRDLAPRRLRGARAAEVRAHGRYLAERVLGHLEPHWHARSATGPARSASCWRPAPRAATAIRSAARSSSPRTCSTGPRGRASSSGSRAGRSTTPSS
jgi:transcription-repair coupling factor (superfamily II helicase)